MHILSDEEKESICHRFRKQGEGRIADWISTQYLVAKTATSGPAGETASAEGDAWKLQ
jgi:hypothetical protein